MEKSTATIFILKDCRHMPDKKGKLDSNSINPTVDLDHFIVYNMKIKKELCHIFRKDSSYRGPYGKIEIGENSYTKEEEFK